MKSIIAVIPVHLESKRFPKKALTKIANKTLLEHVYDNTIKSKYIKKVLVVTNSNAVVELCRSKKYNYQFVNENYQCGTDRIAALPIQDYDIILNIQCDILIHYKNLNEFLKKALETFKYWNVITPIYAISDSSDLSDTNIVKVVKSISNRALYFSRSIIPAPYVLQKNIIYYGHVGIYGFTPEALKIFPTLPESILEKTESLEQLRFLENGIDIHIVVIPNETISINTVKDLEKYILLDKTLSQ